MEYTFQPDHFPIMPVMQKAARPSADTPSSCSIAVFHSTTDTSIARYSTWWPPLADEAWVGRNSSHDCRRNQSTADSTACLSTLSDQIPDCHRTWKACINTWTWIASRWTASSCCQDSETRHGSDHAEQTVSAHWGTFEIVSMPALFGNRWQKGLGRSLVSRAQSWEATFLYFSS